MKKIGYYFKSFIVGIDYYLDNFSYKAVKSKEYSDLAHSSRGIETEEAEHWHTLHNEFIKSFPVVVGLVLSSISIIISIIALLIAISK